MLVKVANNNKVTELNLLLATAHATGAGLWLGGLDPTTNKIVAHFKVVYVLLWDFCCFSSEN